MKQITWVQIPYVTLMKKVRKKHWYKIYLEECVLCGYGKPYRERVYGKKPKNPNKRIFYSQTACSHHFL